MIKAEIIADSKNDFGNRITTFVLTFPRIILAELNTHRMFSRNSASSRAIPFRTMLKRVKENPFIPIAWQIDHKGMQGTKYFEDPEAIEYCKGKWLLARDKAIDSVDKLSTVSEDPYTNESIGITKQLCNRLLEPFMWHTAIVTATEYENFFHLRCPQYQIGQSPIFRSKKDVFDYFSDDPDYSSMLNQESELFWYKNNKGAGEIHIMALAEAMWDAMNESKPKQLEAGEWHIPFGDKIDRVNIMRTFVEPYVTYTTLEQSQIDECIKYEIKIATARCARVSYINYEGKDDYEADIKLHDRLVKMGHWSPFEHCARSMDKKEYYTNISGNAPYVETLGQGSAQLHSNNSFHVFGWSGNFRGFIQYRKMFNGENKTG